MLVCLAKGWQSRSRGVRRAKPSVNAGEGINAQRCCGDRDSSLSCSRGEGARYIQIGIPLLALLLGKRTAS
jgi:hypothetical protein